MHGEDGTVNPDGTGTKAALHHFLVVPAEGSATIRLRLTDTASERPFDGFDELMNTRRGEADDFYAGVLTGDLSDDERMISRTALAGMLWSKQYYGLDMEQWLTEHGSDPVLPNPALRNHEWQHLISEDIISMPDKWEYPWFAAWDLAFHAVALSAVDMPFAKQQLELLLDSRYLHPNGQLPPTSGTSATSTRRCTPGPRWFVYSMDKARTGRGDRVFLESTFQKLMQNFGWWLNRKDADDRNIFQGGFLGLDNIGVFDRSAPLPGGGRIDQADGTAWMSLFSQNMLQMAVELGRENPVYLEQALALLENWAWIAAATNHVGPDEVGLWDEEDGFFYDVLRRPDGSSVPLKVRSVVGLMPLVAATVITAAARSEFPKLAQSAVEFVAQHPALTAALPNRAGRRARPAARWCSAMFNEDRLRRILSRMLDEEEFLGPHGIRAISRWHLEHPYVLDLNGQEYRVNYLPAESDTGMFGGNSNWRGPVWVPINTMLIRAPASTSTSTSATSSRSNARPARVSR